MAEKITCDIKSSKAVIAWIEGSTKLGIKNLGIILGNCKE